ncbi:MAG: hypothetical protein E2O39_16925 [Planctomycetota bacterium]|nr:MAG: hypothetical protein E2O39_16925 [Planctomycetota bacterium]
MMNPLAALVVAGSLALVPRSAGDDPPTFPATLAGVNNARELAGAQDADGIPIRPGVVLRSSSLARAKAEALEVLHEYGVQKLVDLRTMIEITQRGAAPAPFGRKPILVHLPMDVEEWTDDPTELYVKLWNENGHVFSAILNLLADPANHPVLIAGELGMNRVGIVCAMLLELAGVPREAIVADYMNYRGSLTPRRKSLEAVFALWDGHEGGLEGWLAEAAFVHPLTIAAVRHTLKSAEPYAKTEDEEAAEKMLAKALRESAAGRYPNAVKSYARVAKKYPTTQAGILAAQRSQPNAFVGWVEMVRNGPSENRIDIVLMGEGYTLKHIDSYDKQVKNVPKLFERHSLFGEYYAYHNILRAELRSEEDGVDKLGEDTYSTILNGHDSGALQGQVAIDHARVMRQLAEIPYHDSLAIVFAKRGTGGTGGGGVATVGGVNFSTLIHEWGHAFGGLMDEYTTDVGYTGAVRAGPNVSDQSDPAKVAWKHWIDAGRKGVGVHEGAAGRTKGAWKSSVKGCAMQGGTEFCVVCRETLVLAIHAIVDPIDACTPPPHLYPEEDPFAEPLPPLEASEPLEFEVTVMQPTTHELTADWWVLPEHLAPPPPAGRRGRALQFGDRRDRGPLFVIEGAPDATTKQDKRGVHRFELDPAGRKPGRYRLVCRVRDTTMLKGEKWPWVLRDERHLLRSERAWWVVVP